MTAGSVSIVFDPLLPMSQLLATLGVLLLIVLAILLLATLGRTRDAVWRIAVIAVLACALANPTLTREQRETRPDIAVIVIDDSQSQTVADRPAISEAALSHVRNALSNMKEMEVRTVRVGAAGSAALGLGSADGTRLFRAVNRAFADIPRGRLAGLIAITDGQIHDAAAASDPLPAPFHVILTGRRDDSDRRLRIERAPSFAMVDRSVTMSIRVDDPDSVDGEVIPVTLQIDGGPASVLSLPANRSQAINLSLEHAGETIVELRAAPRSGELGLANNSAVHAINGVRDRLRVMLVSGAPHAGERVWRDILKSDPSVDLVHFTILRPPEKQDATPINELSLIPFPIRQLFETKLADFDLIIFDRYRRRGVLARNYLHNIVEYIHDGGAFLEASGPAFTTSLSLAHSPLGAILPVIPTGQINIGGFRPRVTDTGLRHPVTSGLPGSGRTDAEGRRVEEATWGRWLRQIDGDEKRGMVLVDGAGERPLLVLDRVGKGRVAHLLSDHIWLWARGFEGGGPQTELLRRTAHWLMKEPDLEEEDLKVVVQDSRIQATRRSLGDVPSTIEMTRPDGTKETRALLPTGPGQGTASFETSQIGLHRFSDGDLVKLAAVGALNPVELADLRSTEDVLRPVVDATGGGLFWATSDGLPDLRRVRADRPKTGRNWIGLAANEDYVVTGVQRTPLLPGFAVLALVLGLAIIAWRREGR